MQVQANLTGSHQWKRQISDGPARRRPPSRHHQLRPQLHLPGVPGPVSQPAYIGQNLGHRLLRSRQLSPRASGHVPGPARGHSYSRCSNAHNGYEVVLLSRSPMFLRERRVLGGRPEDRGEALPCRLRKQLRRRRVNSGCRRVRRASEVPIHARKVCSLVSVKRGSGSVPPGSGARCGDIGPVQSAAVRKPQLLLDESGVFELLAATR